jgi:hypothetical protein
MERKTPAPGKGAGAGMSIAADVASLTENRPNLQAQALLAMQSHVLMVAHNVRPEWAAMLAAFAFGGAHG